MRQIRWLQCIALARGLGAPLGRFALVHFFIVMRLICN